MRILYVADGRSPTALNWMRHFVENGHEVHLATTFDCRPDLDFASVTFVPVAYSGAAAEGSNLGTGLRSLLGTGARTRLRQWLGPLSVPKAARQLRKVIDRVQPDLVHAMRVPYEGMLAGRANPAMPLIVSIWGNDFTLHARSTPLMREATYLTMRRADALHSDTQRDLNLAQVWGFESERPNLVAPGNGGIRADIFYPLPHATKPDPVEARLGVVNPRGIRSYVRNDVFFKAIPQILRKRPEVRFFCPAMEGESEAEEWIDKLDLDAYVSLMPRLGPHALADVYHSTQVMVSPSMHDGTPNTLLEAMACGCFPVLGDIESVREWVRDGENGLLFDPKDPDALAAAVIQALKDNELRARAAEENIALIRQRAEYGAVMESVEDFYQELIEK